MKVSKITKRLPSLPRSGPFPLTNVQFMKFMELVKAVPQAVAPADGGLNSSSFLPYVSRNVWVRAYFGQVLAM